MQTDSRQKHRLGWAAAIALVAVPVACLNSARVAASPAPVVEDAWDTFSATVSIKQSLVSPAGALLQTTPAVDLRMDRWMASTGWRTAITLQGMDKPVVRGRDGLEKLDNPFLVVRMEYDADGTAPRFFNLSGQRVKVPGTNERKLLAVPAELQVDMPVANLSNPSIVRSSPTAPRPAWFDNVIATPAMKSNRRAALEQRYGAMRGRVNGLDQYVSTTGDSTCEVLVNADAVVPVEMNIAKSSKLVARHTYTHDTRPDGLVVRRLMHSERATGSAGNRLIADLTVANVVLSKVGAK